MQESLAPEHGSELFGDALEELLDRGRVADEGGSHLQTTGWDVTDGSLDVVGDPLDEVGRVLVLDVEHLLIDLLHGHAASENGSDRQVSVGKKQFVKRLIENKMVPEINKFQLVIDQVKIDLIWFNPILHKSISKGQFWLKSS